MWDTRAFSLVLVLGFLKEIFYLIFSNVLLNFKTEVESDDDSVFFYAANFYLESLVLFLNKFNMTFQRH